MGELCKDGASEMCYLWDLCMTEPGKMNRENWKAPPNVRQDMG